MTRYTATVAWALKDGEDFGKGRYSRGHSLTFDGGIEVPASASPHVVGKWAVEAAVDPEEMFVAALANCHMLTFLHKARLAGFVVTAYRDEAWGVMEEVAPGRMAVTRVILNPQVSYDGDSPDQAQRDAMHHAAHEECYIANSVKTDVRIEDRA